MKKPRARPAKRTTSNEVPLARLLAMAYRHLIDGLHARLVEHGYTEVRPAFGYVLLALREEPMTGVDVAALLGTTKQAAAKQLDAMERAGLVARTTHGADARAKSITITAHGRKFLATAESIHRALEADWARVTSRERVEALRRDLRLVLEAAHGGQLPAVRPTG